MNALKRLFTKLDLSAVADRGFWRSLKWQYVANLGIGALGAIYVLLVGHSLGLADFGRYTLALSIATVFTTLLDMRMQEAVIYFKARQDKAAASGTAASEGDDDVSLSFTIDLLAKIVAFALTVTAGAFLSVVLIGQDIPVAIFCAALSILMSKAMNSPAMGLLRVYNDFDKVARIQLIDWATRIALLLILLASGYATLNTVILVQAVSGFVFNALLWIFAARRYANLFGMWALNPATMARSIRRNAKVLFGNQGISVTETVIKDADTTIVAFFLSIELVGVYRMAKNFVSIAWRLADPVYIVIMPLLTELVHGGENEKLQQLLSKLTRLLVLVAIAIYAISVVGTWVASYLFLGPEFALSAQVFPLMALWILVALPLIWTHPLTAAVGRPALQFKASVIASIVGLIGIASGAFLHGVWGAAAGLALAYTMPFFLCYLLLRHERIVR